MMVNLKKVFVATVCLVLLAAHARQIDACEWLRYEPQIELVRGTLALRSYKDPREIEGGSEVTVMVMDLPSPVCVKGGDKDSFNSEECDVRTIQLVHDGKRRKLMHSLLKQRVIVKGTLFHQQSALHHEKILINVISIEKDPK